MPGSPQRIEREIRRLGLEGVMAKRRDSAYQPGERSDAWVKVKFSPRQEFVIGGYKPDATNFESLLLGYFDERRLHFAGKVRAGLTPHLRADMFRRIKPFAGGRCPFVNLPNSAGRSRWGEGITKEDMAKLQWTKPAIVVEVSFVEWTQERICASYCTSSWAGCPNNDMAFIGGRTCSPMVAIRRNARLHLISEPFLL